MKSLAVLLALWTGAAPLLWAAGLETPGRALSDAVHPEVGAPVPSLPESAVPLAGAPEAADVGPSAAGAPSTSVQADAAEEASPASEVGEDLAATGRALMDGDVRREDGRFQPLGDLRVTDETLDFGGSFSPPTLEHMGILAHLMYRFGFARAKVVVAHPYKATAAPSSVSMDLSRTAVEHHNEVLALNSVPYRSFLSAEPGRAEWIGRGGRRFQVEVEDYDVRSKNVDTLTTLRYLRQGREGGAKKNFWVSGGDSFASVPTWSPQWRELFEQANWIVISRPGFDQGEKAINFRREDPLRGVLPDDFVDLYEHRFDALHKIHVYEARDPARPAIYIIDQPVLDDSSTNNRKSLAEPGDHEHAQAGLQPSVFKKSLDEGYFSAAPSQGGYKLMTERNLEVYLGELYKRLETPDGDTISPVERAEYRERSEIYVRLAREAATRERRGWIAAAALAVWEHVVEYFENFKNVRDLRKMLREFGKKLGGRRLAMVYVLGELAEMFVVPPLAFLIGGKAGLALAPSIHPNELIVIPSYLLYRVLKRRSQRKKLAGGDMALYDDLTRYRNQLLRGDPEAIVSRVALSGSVALESQALTLNIVKSRLPRWLPLFVRRLDDRRVTWHDFNVSTNELASMLGDGTLSKKLLEGSDGVQGLYGQRLLEAVLQDPRARLRFDLFAAHRYFRRLFLGEVPEELLGGFSPPEREAIRSLRAQAQAYRSALSAGELAELGELVADHYALMRAAQAEPGRVRSPELWTELLGLMVSRYPGRKVEFDDRALASLAPRLKILAEAAREARPDLFAAGPVLAPALGAKLVRDASAPQGVREKALENAVRHYLRTNAALFSSAQAGGATAFADLLPTTSRGEDLGSGNLIWEMHLLDTHIQRGYSVLDDGFDRAMLYLERRDRHPRAGKVFWDAHDFIEEDIASLREELRRIEYDWLKLKYAHRLGPEAADERLVPGYARIAARYRDAQRRLEAELEGLRELNQMMLGTAPADLVDVEALRREVGDAIGLGDRTNTLGLSVFRRTAGRVKGLASRLTE